MRNLDLATIKMLRSVQKQITGEGFCKIDTEELINYYKKAELYTKSEINELISNIPKFAVEFVSEKPVSNIKQNTFYLIPKNTPDNTDFYEEWIYINERWERIGTTQIDLADYEKTSVINEKLSALKNELEQKIKQNSTDIQTNLSSIQTNRENIAKNTADIASLKTKTQTHDEQLNEITGTISDHNNAIEEINSSIEDINQDTKELRGNQETLAQDINLLNEKILSQEGELGSVGSDVKTQKEEISLLKTDSHTHTNKEALDSINATKIEEWNNKQEALEFDEVPTKDSKKVMTSGAIYSAMSSVGGGQFRRLTYEFSLDDPRWTIMDEGVWGDSMDMDGDYFVPYNEYQIENFRNAGFCDESYYKMEIDAQEIVGNYIIGDLHYNYIPGLSFIKYNGSEALVKMPYAEHGLDFNIIHEQAFKDNTTLESVAITRHYALIEAEAFSGCTSLKTVSMGKGIEIIEKNAFYNCLALTDVYFAGSEDEWSAIQIEAEGNEYLTNATIHYNESYIEAELVTKEYTYEIFDAIEAKGLPVADTTMDSPTIRCMDGIIIIMNKFPFSGYFNVILDLSNSE